MRRITILVLIFFCGTLSAEPAKPQSPDIQRGELLYGNHCSGCHESEVHIRKKHKAKNVGDIQKQVARWASELHLNWSAADIKDVTHFLHQRYYLKQAKE